MVAKNYYNAAHFADSFQRFNDLRENVETCDIRVLATNNVISAHKLVLASTSEYFKNAIYGLLLNDSGRDTLELKEVQYEVLSAIVNYMYTGKIEINSENVYDIYNAADYCLMEFLKERCFDFLQENLEIDNCVKSWVLANNCKYEKLTNAARNFIFANLELVSNTKEFLSLSNEEVNHIFKLWPKDKLYDSFIVAALKWATDKANREDFVINILKVIPFTRISDEYLENVLSETEFIQNNIDCNKWIANIYKEKFKSVNKKLKLEHAELKFTGFVSDRPIIFMDYCKDISNSSLYKYNRRDNSIKLYKKMTSTVSDCKIYNTWIYLLESPNCYRFAFDDFNENGRETVFHHDHGLASTAAILNDSMYIFGGNSSENKGSSIDLKTKQNTSFNLIQNRFWSGVAVNDGSIYICGGSKTNTVERFDPREGRTSQFGSISFTKLNSKSCSAASLPNQLYCSNFEECNMIDLRNNKTWVQIKPPVTSGLFGCIVSSHGKIYSIPSKTIYRYQNASETWKHLGNFSELSNVYRATSFE